jgi:hypothetical protein
MALRLRPYGFQVAEVEQALGNLVVARGQQVHVTRRNPAVERHIRQLPVPKSLAEVKRIIGVPDEVARVLSRPLRPLAVNPALVSSQLAPELTAPVNASLWASARHAVFGTSGSVSPSEIVSIDQWIAHINPVIFAGLFQDITVQSGGRLYIDADVQVLFANNILIEQGGQVLCLGSIVKFDCATLRGFDGPAAATGTSAGTTP